MFAPTNAASRAPVAAERTISDRPQLGEAAPLAQRSEVGDRGRARGSADPLPTARWPRLCHDLRTPLNAILGNTELLLDGSAGPLSSQARACIGDIQTAGTRMMGQIQALLELCRIRAVPVPAAVADLDLLALLRAAHAAAPQSATGLQMTPTGARLVVRGDPVWLDTLAATLIELHPGEDQNGAPSLVSLERPPCDDAGATLRLSWADFRPDQMAALPLALIDAILDLHNGAAALSGDGLRLYWPVARLVHLEPSALLLAHGRKSE